VSTHQLTLWKFQAARFSHHFSRVSDTTEITLGYFYQIVQFLSVDYLDILVQYAMHIVYHVDVRVVVGSGTSGGEVVVHHHHEHGESESECTHESDDGEWKDVPGDEHRHRKHGHVVLYSERVQKTVMHGYDQILAVSEESINQLFLSMWTRGSRSDGDILSKWKHELFSAQFSAPKIRLLSNGKAIMWIHVNEGSLHVKRSVKNLHSVASANISRTVSVSKSIGGISCRGPRQQPPTRPKFTLSAISA
jgi:hypothetical protein